MTSILKRFHILKLKEDKSIADFYKKHPYFSYMIVFAAIPVLSIFFIFAAVLVILFPIALVFGLI